MSKQGVRTFAHDCLLFIKIIHFYSGYADLIVSLTVQLCDWCWCLALPRSLVENLSLDCPAHNELQ